MKILYIITQGEQGGAQKSICDLRLGMRRLGHEVVVAVGEIENEGDRWLEADLEVKSLQREIRPFRDLKALFEIVRLIKKINPDVVHLHSSKAGVVGALACFITRKPSVYTVHGFVFLEPMNLVKKNIYIFLELVSSFLRRFTILITENDLREGKKLFILRNKESYELIYNGLDESIVDKILSRDEARKYVFEKIKMEDKGQRLVGTISNLYKTKGIEYFIDAAKNVSHEDVIYLVFGFGEESYKKELEKLVDENGLGNKFFLLGKTPHAYKYLKGLDLFTLTSVKEGLPYTLLEAKLAGTPILASSVGGIPSMAKNFKIDLFEPKNVRELKDKIESNLKNRQEVDDILPEVYSLHNMISKTESVYKRVVE